MEGYGVDAYLYLPVLGVACENLPQRVIHSPGNLDSSATINPTNHEEILDGDGYCDAGEEKKGDDFYQDTNVRSFDSGLSKRPNLIDTVKDRAL